MDKSEMSRSDEASLFLDGGLGSNCRNKIKGEIRGEERGRQSSQAVIREGRRRTVCRLYSSDSYSSDSDSSDSDLVFLDLFFD
jgi:hypothetical protein